MKLILATAALALTASGAVAADLVVAEDPVVVAPEAFDWSGLYIGVNAGAGSLKSTQPYGDYYGYWYDTDYYGTTEVSDSGFSLGVGVGANAQFGQFVLGIDGDVNWTNLEAWDSDEFNSDYYAIGTQWDWYATLRAKAGVAFDSVLLYATAGVAAVSSTSSFCYYGKDYCGDYTYDASYADTLFGWTAGVGAEVAVSDNVSIKGEVLYIDLPEQTYLTPYYNYDGSEYEAAFQSSAVVGRIGLNWHFD